MPNEAYIQKKVVEYARENLVIAIKLSTLGPGGTSGWPDYEFLYADLVLFVEFKAPGEKPTELQARRMTQLRDEGFRVEVVDNIEQGRRLLLEHFDLRRDAA